MWLHDSCYSLKSDFHGWLAFEPYCAFLRKTVAGLAVGLCITATVMITSTFTQKDIVRFWKYVDKNGTVPAHRPELGKCWIWKARKQPSGYGIFTASKKNYYSHRASYLIHSNFISDEKPFVLHHCDNPPCVNPWHLFPGTTLDNAMDRKQKNRNVNPIGKDHGKSKVTEASVREMRILAARGTTFSDLSRKYGIDWKQVSRIVKRLNWRHVA